MCPAESAWQVALLGPVLNLLHGDDVITVQELSCLWAERVQDAHLPDMLVHHFFTLLQQSSPKTRVLSCPNNGPHHSNHAMHRPA